MEVKVLITGICGFVGSTVAEALGAGTDLTILGVDNLSRPGSERNRTRLRRLGIEVRHGDTRSRTDLDNLPSVDWIIDAAANPSVLAGVTSGTSSREVVEHNLLSTLNLLEFCRAHRAGMIFLSSSRVYSVKGLAELPLLEKEGSFQLDVGRLPPGVTSAGIAETFPTTPPLSLYGATKLTSELLALEYAAAFGFPLWINRCGVLAGAGQFGRPDQGIFSFWIHSWRQSRPLAYTGFNGHQVRDCLHPRDLAALLRLQLQTSVPARPKVVNVGGGIERSMSLVELSDWCAHRFQSGAVRSAGTAPRPFDLPWVVLDSSLAAEVWHWVPRISLEQILLEIADFAEEHPDWLELSAA